MIDARQSVSQLAARPPLEHERHHGGHIDASAENVI